MDLPNWKDQILVITAVQYPQLPEMHCLGMVYAPGLVCSYCGSTLKTGFVVKNGFEDGVFGRECVREEAVSPWRSLMQRARYYLDPTDFDMEEELKPRQRKHLRGLVLLTQLQPWSTFANAMYDRIWNGNSLTERQFGAIEKMISDQGGLEELLLRRDVIRRLSFLATILTNSRDDSADIEKIESLLRQAWRKPLSEAQMRLITAIEEQHYQARNLLTNKIIEQWPLWGGRVDWHK